MQLHRARREIEVAAEMLLEQALRPSGGQNDNDEIYKQLRADIWLGVGRTTSEGDRVGGRIKQFQDGIEELCRPVVDRGYRAKGGPRLFSWLTGS